MTDPRRLSEAVLAAIVKRVARDQDPNLPPNVREISIDRYDLSRHIAWQAEQIDLLIDAHRERQDLLTAMTQKVMEQSSQLARERADHAATVAEHEGERGDNRDAALLAADLATAQAARLAAEARAAELRTALMTAHLNCGCEDGIWHRVDDDGCPIDVRCLQCAHILAALATPSVSGAAAVLAAPPLADAGDTLPIQPEEVDAWEEFKRAKIAARKAREGGRGG